VADPRRDFEIYRPDADGRSRKLTFAWMRIGGDESVAAGAAQVQGRNVLTGIAWSVANDQRVDVTLDGGRILASAVSMAGTRQVLTRFYVDFDWNGQR